MSVILTIFTIKLLNKEKENCDQGQQRLKKEKNGPISVGKMNDDASTCFVFR